MVDEEVNHDSSNKTLDEDEEEEMDYNPKKGFGDFLLTPIYWFKMLARETHWSFVAGVVIIYGINQGLGGALSRISTEYYMKDVQKVQPSEAQIYSGITYIPWMVKPLWGLLTDVIPISGFRRRPYFILAGCIGVMSMLSLSLSKSLHLVLALFALTAGSTGVAIADVTIDACIAQNSNTHPAIAADMQSLCALSSSIGALLGFFISGILVHLIGPKGVYGLLVIPFGLVLLVGIVLDEPHLPDFNYKEVNQKFVEAGKAMWTTLKFPDIWRPCLYMYLSIALCFDIAEGMFYWYTDSKGGPNFSQEKVGFVFSIGSVGSLSGAILYQYALKDHKFRDLLFWTQLLYGISGMLDFMLVLRMNLRLGIPDYFFIVIDESVHQFIGRLKWMPLLVLSSQLCPKGIEGTFFALLMSIDNVGILTSSWSGGLLLHVLKVTRTKFDNLWLAILVRNFFRVSPLFLLFLIPRSDPSPAILQAEDLGEKHDIENFEEIDIELVSLIKNDESNKLAE